jgi:hypothetical protein
MGQTQQEGAHAEAVLGLRKEALALQLRSDNPDMGGEGIEGEGLRVCFEEELTCLL